ncbi:MAG: hypothetical protein K8S62_11600 [Candidatus Sabulitectum sp.]|nr:hypothetical protein [Candidatus Sabulitectum sp.]
MILSSQSYSQSVFFSLLLLFWSACNRDYHQDYFERVACIELPAGVYDVEHFTGSDIAFSSHYTIPRDSIEELTVRLGLSSIPSDDWQPILFTEELSSPWDEIPLGGLVLYGSGASGWNSWDIILHTESASMWVTVYYTDASGDPPQGIR